MADDGQEKRHDATDKKKSDAAEKGQIVKSQELSSATVLLVGAASLAFASGPAARAIEQLILWCWDLSGEQVLDASSAGLLLTRAGEALATAIAVPLGLISIAVIAVGFAQTRFQMAWKALEPKPERLDPTEGFKQKFMSWTPLMELAKGVTKLGALGGLMYWALADEVEQLPVMAALSADQQLAMFVDLGWTLVLTAVPLVLVIAVADYAYNSWKTGEDLKMTDQEVKEERKQQDGDPYMKAARRSRQRMISMGIGLAKVRDADLIITNPTHYAIAIRYRKDEAPAPVILAMGVDHMAMKIRAEARKHDVIRVENRALARALYASGQIGQMVPEELFAPVAKVLAVVLRKRRKSA
ncbi:MAG: EscU/YscU/HrcU family type III secretion system export apparatus switch protein [Proteobacteria bacterium]|nr:EscU/YscU/HrcU family type III secretion system export apparatus switch protein [Pseudomonadota bacterium]MCP4919868.1 EscU/YscU/HrcU family type III secretion system export apparatus switch protein [Pseudomonadota bacterium]